MDPELISDSSEAKEHDLQLPAVNDPEVDVDDSSDDEGENDGLFCGAHDQEKYESGVLDDFGLDED